MGEPGNDGAKSWTFLTNHARVLVEIARNPRTRLRDIAAETGITERSAQNIVNDLEAAGYITRKRVGRRNRYIVDPTRPFRHPADADQRIQGLLTLFTDHDQLPRPEVLPMPPPAAGPDASSTE